MASMVSNAMQPKPAPVQQKPAQQNRFMNMQRGLGPRAPMPAMPKPGGMNRGGPAFNAQGPPVPIAGKPAMGSPSIIDRAGSSQRPPMGGGIGPRIGYPEEGMKPRMPWQGPEVPGAPQYGGSWDEIMRKISDPRNQSIQPVPLPPGLSGEPPQGWQKPQMPTLEQTRGMYSGGELPFETQGPGMMQPHVMPQRATDGGYRTQLPMLTNDVTPEGLNALRNPGSLGNYQLQGGLGPRQNVMQNMMQNWMQPIPRRPQLMQGQNYGTTDM